MKRTFLVAELAVGSNFTRRVLSRGWSGPVEVDFDGLSIVNGLCQ